MREHRLSGGKSVRLGPWRGNPESVTIATYANVVLRPSDISQCVDMLAAQGVTYVLTAALMPLEQHAFADCGFETLRELVLLRRPLDDALLRPAVRLRRWRARELAPILAVDAAAFEAFWRFDDASLRDARSATPHHVLRVPRAEPITAYALSGVASGRGYLQRLAVAPESAGAGLGSALLIDALRWMRGRRASQALVNTQFDNHRALELYERHGFVAQPDPLRIMHRDI